MRITSHVDPLTFPTREPIRRPRDTSRRVRKSERVLTSATSSRKA